LSDHAVDSPSWAEYRANQYWAGLRLDESAAMALSRRRDLRVITSRGVVMLADMLDRARTVAAELKNYGVAAGNRVVLQIGPRAADDFGLLLALSTLDATVFLSPPGASPRESSAILRRSDASIVLAAGPQVRNAAADTDPDHVLHIEVDVDAARVEWAKHPSVPASGSASALAVLASPTRYVTFTSGTTGEPKGVQHGYDSLQYAGDQLLRCSEPGDGPVFGLLSLTHASGLAFSLYSGLANARDLVLYEGKWSGELAYELICRYEASWSVGTPTHLHDLVSAAARARRRRGFTMCVGGARVSPESVVQADALGVTVCRIFGLSECLGHTTTSSRDPLELRMVSEGRPFPGTELIAFAPDGERVEIGVAGEAGCRGPSLFLGYLGQGSLAQSLSVTGHFMTGDLIQFREDGTLFVAGRIKDIVIRGGENIDVNEVEGLLSDIPGVTGVVALGVPDPRLGERLGVVLEVPDGELLDVASVRSHLDAKSTPLFKIPEYVATTAALPRNSVNKVLRPRAKEFLLEKVADEAVHPHST
jgi:acyl-CoA synthetase (AMP-forming)/AMP-acid ligase II